MSRSIESAGCFASTSPWPRDITDKSSLIAECHETAVIEPPFWRKKRVKLLIRFNGLDDGPSLIVCL